MAFINGFEIKKIFFLKVRKHFCLKGNKRHRFTIRCEHVYIYVRESVGYLNDIVVVFCLDYFVVVYNPLNATCYYRYMLYSVGYAASEIYAQSGCYNFYHNLLLVLFLLLLTNYISG